MMRQIKAERQRRFEFARSQEILENEERVRERCRTLSGFVREAWPVLEPATTYIHNWHVDAICEHLEAISRGGIQHLLGNVPPGSSKSLLVSVMWQAWEWGPAGLPHMRYLSTSYNDKPVTRDTRKTRDLIRSDWYQSLWPETELIRFGETSFSNGRTGSREGSSFGALTSQRGDRVILDDPHSTETAESETERDNTTRKFREGLLNRLNDQAKSSIVVIMQRLHQNDISGVIDKYNMDFEHLMLPMEFEPDRKCKTIIGFEDPRKQDGELLDPVRFPKEEVEKLKNNMGSYAYAGQYQQRPVPREGGMFKHHWFNVVQAIPAGTRLVRGWDLAASTKSKSPYTVGLKLGRTPEGRFIIVDVKRERVNTPRQMIKTTASQDGHECFISYPQDPGQAGKDQAKSIAKDLAGYKFTYSPESGDKATRAEPLAAQCEAGNVDILHGDWNTAFLDEICAFPFGEFMDQVDAASRAFNELAKPVAQSKTRTIVGMH